ncbi:MAG: oligosaccharide flippase family protein [Nanoarchaeota archaeon]
MKDSSEIKDQLMKNATWGMISSIINRAGGFILIILISRMLMPEGFGKYSLAMIIAMFFITFSDLGINQTLIRYVSLELDTNSKKAISYFKHLLKIRFFLTMSVSLILLIGARIISGYIYRDSNLFIPLVVLSIYVFFISLSSFFESLFFIKKNVIYISIKEVFSVLFRVAFIILIWFFVVSELKLIWIFISLAYFSILSFLFVFYFSRKRYPPLFKAKEIPIDKKDMYRFLFFINIQNISILVLSSIPIMLLGFFLTSEFVGYYNSSWALASGIISLLFSFSYVFLPVFANAKEETFRPIINKIFKLSFMLALPISFGLSLLAKFFIIVIYGEAYLFAATPLSILAFIIPFIVGINLALDSFSARNKQKKFAYLLFVFALASILLNYFFIKFLSALSGETTLLGISIVNLIIWSLCFICSVYYLKKELNINVFSGDLIKFILSCFVMSAFILLALNLFGNLNLLSGVVIIILSMVVYFSFLSLIKGITKEDFALITQAFKKK